MDTLSSTYDSCPNLLMSRLSKREPGSETEVKREATLRPVTFRIDDVRGRTHESGDFVDDDIEDEI